MTTLTKLIMGQDGNGNVVPIQLVAVGDGTYKLGVDASLTVGPITIGAVKMEDAASLTQAKVGADTAIAIGDNALATHDPEIGQVGDLQASGTVIGLLSAIVPPNPNVGVSGHNVVSADASAAPVAITSAPTAGQRVDLHTLIVSTDTNNLIAIFTEETSGTELFRLYLGTNSQPILTDLHVQLATINKRIMVQTNKAGNIAVTALWNSVP